MARVRSNNNGTGIVYTTHDGKEVEVRINNYNPEITNDKNFLYHNYDETSEVTGSQHVSDKTIIDRNFREEPAPTFGLWGTDTPVTTGGESYAFPVGTVTHYVVQGPDGQTIIVNVTKDGHMLHPGVVVRELYYDENGRAYIDETGVGTGLWGTPNELMADWLWDNNADRIGIESIYEETTGQKAPPSNEPPVGTRTKPEAYGPYLPGVSGPFQNGETATVSPLVIDMDGDGVELTAMNGPGSVYFDIDNDGFKEASGWVRGGDALLVTDRNNNGVIDSQNELFGNNAAYANGFANLKTFDSNNDNKITSADANFSKLKVWIDANQDGISQSGELYSLTAKKITSINLAYSNVDYILEGNPVKQESTVTINGQTRKIADVWFSHDNLNTAYAGNYEWDVRTLYLPTLRGYGKLPDLHIAMSLDNGAGGLLEQVHALVRTQPKDLFSPAFDFEGKVADILFRWAHVDGIAPESRGSLDARKVGFIEAFLGEYFRDSATSIVNPAAAALLQQSWDNLVDNISVRILAQSGHLNSLFMDSGTFNPLTDTFEGAFIPNIAGLNAIKPVYNGEVESYIVSWASILEVMANTRDMTTLSTANKNAINALIVQADLPGLTLDTLLNVVTSSTPLLTGDALANTLIGNDAGNYMYGNAGNDIIVGMGGNDSISGGDGNDRLYGHDGDDYLSGDAGDDIFFGGAGDDRLYDGQGGNDTYVYTSGLDSIYDYGGSDVIKFGPGITASNITFQRDFRIESYQSDFNLYQLKILLNGQTAFEIDDHFVSGNAVERILFANGSSLDLTQFRNVNGTTGNDTLNGLDNSLLLGDLLYGSDGNDTLNGKKGNDHLWGGAGNDKYVYSAGSGQGTDRIQDDSGEDDSITLGAGYTSSNVTLERIGAYDLAIKSAGQTLFVIEGQFYNYSSIERLVYGNGAVLNLLTYSHTVNGTAANDTIYGTYSGAGGDRLNGLGGNDYITAMAGNDVVTGGDGDDRIYGDEGDDTLSGNAGNDTVYGGLGNDTVIYESGLDRFSDSGGTDVINIAGSAITAANMTLRRPAGNPSDLDVLLNGTHAFTIQGQFAQNQGFETIKFANGTTFNLSAVQYTSEGGAGNDYLYGIGSGGNPNDIIRGNAGNDYILGYAGNDSLTGGKGNDYIEGGEGNDTYYYNSGDGLDSIFDQSGTDVIQLGTGFVKADLTWQRDGLTNNMSLFLKGVRVATLQGQFSQSYQIETVKFADGTTQSLTGLKLTTTGTESADNISGLEYNASQNDTINALGGNDYIYANTGNDVITGGKGNDYIDGGSGNDTYIYNSGDGLDTINDTAGTDLIKIGTGFAKTDLTFQRSDKNLLVFLKGTQAFLIQNQFIENYGVETIQFADNSTYTLTNFNLTVNGTTGSDYLQGTDKANDTLNGLAGDDYIYGHGGNDILTGGAGADYLYGGKGDDTYIFRAGDSLSANPDSVSENFDEGTDTIKLTGGILPANVRIWSDYYGGLTIQYSPTNQIIVSGVYNSTTNSYVVGIERITFDNGTVWSLTAGLSLTDSDDAHSIYGSASADVIDGRGGDDYLHGRAGNDTITGGAGMDYLYGGLGDDTYVFKAGDSLNASPDNIIESFNEGTDTIKLTGGVLPANVRIWSDYYGGLTIQYSPTNQIIVSGVYNSTTNSYMVGIERITFDNGTVWNLTAGLSLTDSDEAHTVYGSASADVIDGRGGDDYLHGQAGNDTITGGTGMDYLYGGLGNDTYVFKAGDSLAASPDYVYEGFGEGTDTIKLTGGILPENVRMWADYYGGLTIQYSSTDQISAQGVYDSGTSSYVTAIERIAFDNGTVWNLAAGLSLTDSDEAHSIYGSGSGDTIDGRGGNDYLYGRAGNDTIIGGAGDDYLYGDEGNDVLLGGAGIDYLSGGLGADTFKFQSGGGIDSIQDFSKTEDRLDIRDLLSGYDASKPITDYIQITTSGSGSIVRVDGNGATGGASWTQIATIEGVTGLTDELALKNAGTIIV